MAAGSGLGRALFPTGSSAFVGQKRGRERRERTERDGVESRELRREPLAISQTIYVALYKRGRRRQREREKRETRRQNWLTRGLLSVL